MSRLKYLCADRFRRQVSEGSVELKKLEGGGAFEARWYDSLQARSLLESIRGAYGRGTFSFYADCMTVQDT